MSKIEVLDKGYVRRTHQGGDDLIVVNAARVSFDRESTWKTNYNDPSMRKLADKDVKLLSYLATHGHTSPFRHASLGLEIYAPLMVARQWWKHVVGAPFVDTPWNESSRRYVTEEPEVYLPDIFWAAPESKKQGSGEEHERSDFWRQIIEHHQDVSVQLYNTMVADGVAVEQARLALPAYGLYVRWRWVPSLQAAAHFVNLRDHGDAQSEIKLYATAVDLLAVEAFPQSWRALRAAQMS